MEVGNQDQAGPLGEPGPENQQPPNHQNQRGRGRGRPRGRRGRGGAHLRGGRGARVRRPVQRYGYEDDDDDEDLEQDEENEAGQAQQAQAQQAQANQAQAQAGIPAELFQPFLQLVNDLLVQRAVPQQQQQERPRVRIPHYEGDQCYSVFRAQFMALTSQMTEQERGQRLLEALRGKAATVLTMLQQQQRDVTFTNLDDILARTFSMPKSLWQRKRDFEELKQQEGQSLHDFAQNVERIGREYMVTHTESDLQEALVTAFVKGLKDKSAAAKLAFAPVDNLQDALKHLNRGLLLCTEEPPTKKVRLTEVADESQPGPSSKPDPVDITAIVNALKAIVPQTATPVNQTVAVRSVEDEATPGNPAPVRGRGRGRGRGFRGRGQGRGAGQYNGNDGNGGNRTCHYCGKVGHFIAECRNRIRDQQQGNYRGGHNGGNNNRNFLPYFPPEALHTAMAYYRFQQDQQNVQNWNRNGNGGNGIGNNGNRNNFGTNNDNGNRGGPSGACMPYVPNNQGN